MPGVPHFVITYSCVGRHCAIPLPADTPFCIFSEIPTVYKASHSVLLVLSLNTLSRYRLGLSDTFWGGFS